MDKQPSTLSPSVMQESNPTKVVSDAAINPEPSSGAPLQPVQAALEHGAFGTGIFSGFITQEEYNFDLIGLAGINIFDEMRRSDATVRASLNIVKYPILATNFDIEEASDDPLDQEVAAFVKYNLMELLNFKQFMREAFTFLDFGFFVGEKMYDWVDYPGDADGKGAGKRLMLKAIHSRKQASIRRWLLPDGRAGVVQMPNTGGVFEIPAEKLVIISFEREGANYAGVSLLRSAYKHWKLKSSLELIEAMAHEKRHMGVPVIKPPQTVVEGDRLKAEMAVKNVRANQQGYIMLPFGWELEWADMKSPGTDIRPTIDHHDRQIMKNVLGQFLEIGSHGSSGTRNVGEDQGRILEQSLEDTAGIFTDAIMSDVIKQLVDMNYTVKRYPKLTHDRIADDNVQVLSAAVAALGAAGFLTPDAPMEDSLRKTLHLPDMSDEMKASYDDRQAAREAALAGAATAGGGTAPSADAKSTGKPAAGDSKAAAPDDNAPGNADSKDTKVTATDLMFDFHKLVGAALDENSNT